MILIVKVASSKLSPISNHPGQMTNKMVSNVFRQATKALQFVAKAADPEKIALKEELRTNASIPNWKRRKLELKLHDITHWKPKTRLNAKEMARLCLLYKSDPHRYSFSELARLFCISFEACRRIVKSSKRQALA